MMNASRRQFLAGILVMSGLLLTSIPRIKRQPRLLTWVSQMDDRPREAHGAARIGNAFDTKKLGDLRRAFDEFERATRRASAQFRQMPCIVWDSLGE